MQSRNMAKRTQVCSVEIWIEETLGLLKTRGVVTEKILLLLKYHKTNNNSSIKWDDTYCTSSRK